MKATPEQEKAMEMQRIIDALATMTQDDLQYLAGEIKHQQQLIAKAMLDTLKVGSRVRFVACRPKYLIGRTATVKKIAGDSVYVDGAEVGSNFANQPNLKVKKSMIEVA